MSSAVLINKRSSIKWLLLLPLALGLVSVLFSLMQQLVEPSNLEFKDYGESQPMQYVRIKRDERVVEKSRELPEPEEIVEQEAPPKPSVETTAVETPNFAQVDMPKMTMPMSFNQNFALGTFAGGGADGNVLPLVQIKPRYPRQAKSRGIEGWVKVKITIAKDGTVKEVNVLEAKPRGMFERAALRAVKRWKFKPEIVNGVAVENQSVQTISFKLDDK